MVPTIFRFGSTTKLFQLAGLESLPGTAMVPTHGDTAGPSSSQDDPAATVKKRNSNRPQCNRISPLIKKQNSVNYFSSLVFSEFEGWGFCTIIRIRCASNQNKKKTLSFQD